MTNKELENKLQTALQQKLKSKGYVDSGDLLNSIKFTVTETADGPKVSLEANDYIKYLQKGKLLSDFFTSNEFLTPYGDYLSFWMSNTITNGLQS
jgi:hypothetical protein